jgi:hypothetical protein
VSLILPRECGGKIPTRRNAGDYARDYYTEGDIMINIPGLDAAVEAFRTYYRCAVDPTFQRPLDQTIDGPSLFSRSGSSKPGC